MVATEHLDFSLSLHHRSAPPAGRSFCWSPYSVASALGLVVAATGGTTHAELAKALRCGDNPAGLRDMLADASELNATGGGEPPVLAVANTLWAHEQLPLQDSYLRELRGYPGSALRNAPFRADPEAARRRINEDVAETTRGLIPELLPAGAVDTETVAALVNALYLKTSWQQAWDEQETRPRPFHAPGGQHDVPTMHVTRKFGYAARDGWQVVSLPAVGDVDAVVLLPDGDLDRAEPDLDARTLEALFAAPEQRRLDLFLPRFRVTGEAELDGPLGDLGVRTLFTPAADFSPLTDDPLRVSTVVHESVLRIDENGLEGAAATAAMMRLTAIVREQEAIEVRVDRPFLFVVRHRPSGALYFLARVTDPT